MSSVQMLLPEGFETIARTRVQNADYLLCKNPTSKEYLTAEKSILLRQLKAQRFFPDRLPAIRDYIHRIAIAFELNLQSMATLLVTPEGELRSKQSNTEQPVKASGASILSNSSRDDRTTHLCPSVFFHPIRTPQWLIAKHDMLVMDTGLKVKAGSLFKLLAMNLIPPPHSLESTIHLQDKLGNITTLPLHQICKHFDQANAQGEVTH